MAPKHHKNSTYVTALARGFEILRCFDAARPELSTMDIAKLTGLPQSTVWRLCNTLVELGCLLRQAGSDKLSIGLGLLGYGYAALPSLDLDELAEMQMKRLADELHAGVSLSIRDKHEMLIVKRVRGQGGLVSAGRIGSHVPIVVSAAGWAYLAALPHGQRESLAGELQRQAGLDWPRLHGLIDAEIRRYGDKGFILNIGTYRPEINYAAVPIPIGDTIYTLHCSGLASMLPAELLQAEVGPSLVELAKRIRVALSLSPAVLFTR